MNLFKKVIKELCTEFKLKHHTYINSSGFKLPFAVRLECIAKGTKFSTWGVGESEDLAYLKALMEMLERMTINFSSPTLYSKGLLFRNKTISEISKDFGTKPVLLHPLNSNGCSAHFFSGIAIENSKSELVERHTVLAAQMLNIHPRRVSLPSIHRINKGIELESFYWICGSYFVSISVLKVQAGFYFSFGCSKNLDRAILKSFHELVPTIIFSFDEGAFLEGDCKIIEGDIQSFSRYWRISGDRRYYNFLTSGNGSNNSVPRLDNFFISKFKVPSFLKLNFPFSCYRCISPEAQQLFFDSWDKKYINPKVFNGNVLPVFPHPIA